MFLDPNNLPIHSMNMELEISLAQYWPEMQNWWIIKMHSVHFSNCPAKPREEQITFLPFSNPKEWNSSHVSHRVMIYGKVGVMRELCRFEASLRERTNTRLTLNSCARRWRPKLLEHCIVCVNDLLSILGTIGQCPSEMNRLDIFMFSQIEKESYLYNSLRSDINDQRFM